jgi:hypothetical protein
MDVMLISDPQTNQLKQRLIACGHSNGLLDLYITQVQSDGTFKTIHKTLEYDSFISTVKFFYYNQKPLAGKTKEKKISDLNSINFLDEQPHLLVTSALEPAVIYR